MAENSKIEWTTHTFNPWRGCTKVAEGCKHCYADTLSKRNPGTLGIWGPNGTRVVASEAMWREPLKWNHQAEQVLKDYSDHAHRVCGDQTIPLADPPRRPRVFCASLADVFEDWQGPVHDSSGRILNAGPVGDETWDRDRWWICDHTDSPRITLDDVRRRLFGLIYDTPYLDWLLLTKRPENIRRMMPDWEDHPCLTGDCPHGLQRECDAVAHERKYRQNLWLGTSVATPADADRNISELLKCRNLAPVLFVSAEPLLEAVDLTGWLGDFGELQGGPFVGRKTIDWTIVGGESGPHARPCCLEHIDDLRRQCKSAGIPCLVKQLGAFPVTTNSNIWDFERSQLRPWGDHAASARIVLNDKKGGDWSEWPEDLRVRQFPEVPHV